MVGSVNMFLRNSFLSRLCFGYSYSGAFIEIPPKPKANLGMIVQVIRSQSWFTCVDNFLPAGLLTLNVARTKVTDKGLASVENSLQVDICGVRKPTYSLSTFYTFTQLILLT